MVVVSFYVFVCHLVLHISFLPLDKTKVATQKRLNKYNLQIYCIFYRKEEVFKYLYFRCL